MRQDKSPVALVERPTCESAGDENPGASRMRPDEMIPGLDPFPFVRVIWHSPEAQQQWGPVLARAQGVHDRAEYEMVRQGARKCATLHISPQNYDRMMEQIQRDRLVWLPITRTRNYSGFSHKHYPVDQLDMNSSVYGVLARTLENAEAFRGASNGRRTDHLTIGELLGFPKCCCEAFVRWWPTYFDPVYQCAEASEHQVLRLENYEALLVEPHVATHQMLRYAGFRLTSHFPCSLQCQASIEVGKVWLEVAKRADPQGTEALLQVLSLPGEWSVLHGIAVVETPYFSIVTNSLPTRHKWVVRWKSVRGY